MPWVPYLSLANTRVVSDRVERFIWDQFANLPALERIALTPRAIAETPVSSPP